MSTASDETTTSNVAAISANVPLEITSTEEAPADDVSITQTDGSEKLDPSENTNDIDNNLFTPNETTTSISATNDHDLENQSFAEAELANEIQQEIENHYCQPSDPSNNVSTDEKHNDAEENKLSSSTSIPNLSIIVNDTKINPNDPPYHSNLFNIEATLEEIKRANEEKEHLEDINRLRQHAIATLFKSHSIITNESNENENHHLDTDGSDSNINDDNNDESISSNQTVSITNRTNNASKSNKKPPTFQSIPTDYIKLLDQLDILWDDIETFQQQTEHNLISLTEDVSKEDKQFTELFEAFMGFQHEIAKESRDDNNKLYNMNSLQRYEAEIFKYETQLSELRLNYFHSLSHLHSLQCKIKEKEKVADGLHFIDFEQLKIENATLNEKIEERNEEIGKMKKKCMAMTRAITHIREKCDGIRRQNAQESIRRQTIQQQLEAEKTLVNQWKDRRQRLRIENEEWKKREGFVGNDKLVIDFESKKREVDKYRQIAQFLREELENEKRRNQRRISKRMQLAQTQKMIANTSSLQSYYSYEEKREMDYAQSTASTSYADTRLISSQSARTSFEAFPRTLKKSSPQRTAITAISPTRMHSGAFALSQKQRR